MIAQMKHNAKQRELKLKREAEQLKREAEQLKGEAEQRQLEIVRLQEQLANIGKLWQTWQTSLGLLKFA